MRLILVRHGAAAYAELQVFAGATACPGLTEDGRTQARRLCQRFQRPGELPPEAILISSPFARAVETSRLLAPAFLSSTVVTEPGLEEMGIGIADGMSWADHAAQFGYFDEKQEPDRIWAPGGESWNLFRERVHGFLNRVRHEYDGRTVVAVTHGGVIDVTMRHLLGIPVTGALATFFPSNAGLTEWSWSAETSWKLERYNDTAHLDCSS